MKEICYKNMNLLIDYIENIEDTEKLEINTFQKFKLFLDKISYLISDVFNKIYTENNNFSSLLALNNSEFMGWSKQNRDFNKRLFGQNYIEEDLIYKHNLKLGKSLNSTWISKLKKINEMYLETFYKITHSDLNFNLFISYNYNLELSSLLSSLYQIIEPLTKKILFGQVEKNISNMNSEFTKLSEKVDQKFIDHLIKIKNKFINSSKHNDNYQSLKPLEQLLNFAFLFIFITFIMSVYNMY